MSSGWNRGVIGGGTQDELVQLCNSNAATLQDSRTLKKWGYRLTMLNAAADFDGGAWLPGDVMGEFFLPGDCGQREDCHHG